MNNRKNVTADDFCTEDIQQAILNSIQENPTKSNISREASRKSKFPSQDEQFATAQRRLKENYEVNQAPNHNPLRSERTSHSCNFKCIFKRGVQLTLASATLGLAAYLAINHTKDIQNALGNLQDLTIQLISKITALIGKDFLANLSSETKNRLIIGLFLIFIKAHKVVADIAFFLAKTTLNHSKLALSIALLTVVAIYVPQANYYATPYLAKASHYLTTSITQNPLAKQIANYLVSNAELISVTLFNLMVIGCIQKAINKYFGNEFNGTAHRL